MYLCGFVNIHIIDVAVQVFVFPTERTAMEGPI